MARINLTTGACPVCDEDVPRTVHDLGGLRHEVFHCKTDGRLAYGATDALLSDVFGPRHLAAPADAVPLVQ